MRQDRAGYNSLAFAVQSTKVLNKLRDFAFRTFSFGGGGGIYSKRFVNPFIREGHLFRT